MRKFAVALVLLAVLLAVFGCALFRDRSDSKLVSLEARDAGLAILPLSPAFDPLVHDYTIETPGTLIYFAAVAPEGAAVSYTPSLGAGTTLSTGATGDYETMTIEVTSEDGSTTTTYTITSHRTL